MTALQQIQAEYELSKYVRALCGLSRAVFTYRHYRYLQLFRGGKALLLAEDAALRGSLNDRVELTIVRLGIVTAPGNQTMY